MANLEEGFGGRRSVLSCSGGLRTVDGRRDGVVVILTGTEDGDILASGFDSSFLDLQQCFLQADLLFMFSNQFLYVSDLDL